MSLARRLLLRASRSAWLARELRRRAFFRRAVRRFMPGEDRAAALAAAAGFAPEGIGSVLTQLGEQVTSRDEAAVVRDHYLETLDQIRARALPTELSVKLTHLGVEQDRGACQRAVLALARRAHDSGSFLWVDMEESRYVDATLDLVRDVRATGVPLGVCVQAYLRRTPADVEALLERRIGIRLVKGAYNEPVPVALPRKRDVDAAYLTLAGRMLQHAGRDGSARAVFGTHDLSLVEAIRARGAASGAWEIHMLYGIRAAAQRALTRQGCRVRVLISYGSAWFPWYMRRLAERPANVWFVLRNLI